MAIQAVEERALETLVGPLAKKFPQLVRDTILHSDQLTTERRTNPGLRDQWFYTADFPLYTVEKEGKQIIYVITKCDLVEKELLEKQLFVFDIVG